MPSCISDWWYFSSQHIREAVHVHIAPCPTGSFTIMISQHHKSGQRAFCMLLSCPHVLCCSPGSISKALRTYSHHCQWSNAHTFSAQNRDSIPTQQYAHGQSAASCKQSLPLLALQLVNTTPPVRGSRRQICCAALKQFSCWLQASHPTLHCQTFVSASTVVHVSAMLEGSGPTQA